jgi:hypothetical protein
MYATKIYCIDQKEQMGKAPGRSVYMVPVVRLVRAVKQKMLWASQISSTGSSSLTWRHASRMAGRRERVERMHCQWRHMWPLSVAVENGRCVWTRHNVIPGIVASTLLRLSACSNVAAGGEQRAWWTNRAYSAAVDVASTLVAIAMGGLLVGVMVGGNAGESVEASGIIHRPVRVHLLAHSTVRLRYEMVHPILVKAISQPELQSTTTNMREWDAKLGMM